MSLTYVIDMGFRNERPNTGSAFVSTASHLDALLAQVYTRCMNNQEQTTAAANESLLRNINTETPVTVSFEYRKKNGETRAVVGKVAAIKPEYVLINDEDRGGAFRAFRFDGMLSRVKVS